MGVIWEEQPTLCRPPPLLSSTHTEVFSPSTVIFAYSLIHFLTPQTRSWFTREPPGNINLDTFTATHYLYCCSQLLPHSSSCRAVTFVCVSMSVCVNKSMLAQGTCVWVALSLIIVLVTTDQYRLVHLCEHHPTLHMQTHRRRFQHWVLLTVEVGRAVKKKKKKNQVYPLCPHITLVRLLEWSSKRETVECTSTEIKETEKTNLNRFDKGPSGHVMLRGEGCSSQQK